MATEASMSALKTNSFALFARRPSTMTVWSLRSAVNATVVW